MEIVKTVVIILLISCASFSQNLNQNLKKRNEELSKLRKEVEALEKKLLETSRKERESYNALQTINQKIFALNKYITALETEIAYSNRIIDSLQAQKKAVDHEYEKIKTLYAKSIKFSYKYGQTTFLQSIFNSKSVYEAVARYKYLKNVAQKTREHSQKLKFYSQKLDSIASEVASQNSRKKSLLENLSKEKLNLLNSQKTYKNLIASLKINKFALLDEIKLKKQAQEEIKNIIVKLNEEKKRNIEQDKKVVSTESSKSSEKKQKNNDFINQYGKLPWPIRGGKLVREYGLQRNQNLNTVTMNYGIDIKAGNSKDVVAVAEGVVSAINWVPAYGPVVIISHPQNLKTVYARLGEIYVKEKDKVTQGSVIGKVAASLEGDILHFQIWNERSAEDPMDYLATQ